MDPRHLERLLTLAQDLLSAPSPAERARLGAEAGAELLGRGVTVQLYRADGAVHAHAGPEMSALLERVRLGGSDPIGEVVVDGAGLSNGERAALERLGSILTESAQAEARDAARRRALGAGLRVAAGLATERDPSGPDRVARRAMYARLIGEELGADTTDELELAALLVGVGRARLPVELLAPAHALTPAEEALVDEHLQRGARVLGAEADLRPAARAVRDLGSRWDASEDPDRLPLAARVVAVACAYEQHTTPAPRGAGESHAEALIELEREAGGRFDPRVVDALRVRGDEIDAVRRRAVGAVLCG